MAMEPAYTLATSESQTGSGPEGLLPARIPLLVVDDDESVLQVTRLVLSRYHYKHHPIEILEAHSASEARSILAERADLAVVLLDVVMESDDAGLQLVDHIRNTLHNHRVRILLRTGQPGNAPERQVVQDYDINDYLLKSEVTQARMYLSLTTAIRGYSDILLATALAGRVGVAEQRSDVAQRASLAKTQFLAHMSHEIRTPLNGIAGIVDLLEMSDLNADQRALLRDLRHAGDALLGVVNDVLDVTKIEAGKFELNITDFSLQDMLDKVCAVFSSGMKCKGIRFRQEFQQVWPATLRGDAQRIQQILINFLSNALKFTPAGGDVCLRVRCLETGSGYELLAEVDDNGTGIRLERLAQIFNAYEQESAQTSLLFGGTGLGLSLSRNLAELMHGQIGADSEPGQGSRFWVKIPLQKSHPVVRLAPLPDKAALPPLDGMVVAVCEDDAISRRIMVRMLERWGIRVLACEHGQELLDDGGFVQADAVILDYHMPIMDGTATAQHLRALGYERPLLALTGVSTDAERQQCLRAGMDAVLGKPVDWFALHDWLSQYHQRAAGG